MPTSTNQKNNNNDQEIVHTCSEVGGSLTRGIIEHVVMSSLIWAVVLGGHHYPALGVAAKA